MPDMNQKLLVSLLRLLRVEQLSTEPPSDDAEMFRIKVLQNYGGLGAELTQRLAEPPEKLYSMTTLQRLFSLQESFGHSGGLDRRSAPSLVAWIILNLRLCFFEIHISTLPIPGQPQNKLRILQPGESSQKPSRNETSIDKSRH